MAAFAPLEHFKGRAEQAEPLGERPAEFPCSDPAPCGAGCGGAGCGAPRGSRPPSGPGAPRLRAWVRGPAAPAARRRAAACTEAAGAGLFLCARGARFSAKSMPTHRRLKKKNTAHNQHTAESWILTREKCLSCANHRLNEGGFTEIHEWELGRPGKHTGKPAISGDPELPGSLPLLQPLRGSSGGAGGWRTGTAARRLLGERRTKAPASRCSSPASADPRPRSAPGSPRVGAAAAGGRRPATGPRRGGGAQARRAGGRPPSSTPRRCFLGEKARGRRLWNRRPRRAPPAPAWPFLWHLLSRSAGTDTPLAQRNSSSCLAGTHFHLSSKALWHLRTVQLIVRK